ncbi:HAD domain-containing protein [Kitasatospora sp. NPDC058170]|uniref:HAD domain-containing protein n=1 Tax=Kitasatospora sp. NPDC058170 TaxID=3346364 RepID=UPI0036DACE2B
MRSLLPLLFLDVDGPLNPYAAKPHRRPEGYLTHRVKPDSWVARFPRRPGLYVRPLRLWLNPRHGPELLSLPCELVWATTWMDEANTWIAPLLGLPRLPFVDWPQLHQEDPEGLHWKTRHLVARAAGRRFVWVDDELGPQDVEWIAANHPGEALALRIDARLGLREGDFATVREWVA